MHLIDLNGHPQPFFVALLDIKLFLYTRSEARREIDLFRPLEETSFNKSDLTVFMIHGWQDDGAKFPMVIDAYLSHGSFNCILVDWSEGSSKSSRRYLCGISRILCSQWHSTTLWPATVFMKWPSMWHGSSRMHTRKEWWHQTCTLLGTLWGKCIRNSSFSFCKPYFRAQIAGAIGKNMSSFKIEKIFGLDPAGPLFENTSSDKRLNKDDAWVDRNLKCKRIKILALQRSSHCCAYNNSSGDAEADWAHWFLRKFWTRPAKWLKRGNLNTGIDSYSSSLDCGFDAMEICGHSRVMDYFAESINSDGFIGICCSPLHYTELVKEKNCVCPSQKTEILTPFGKKQDDFSRIALITTFAASPFATNFAPFPLNIEQQESRFIRYRNNVLCWLGYYSDEKCAVQLGYKAVMKLLLNCSLK